MADEQKDTKAKAAKKAPKRSVKKAAKAAAKKAAKKTAAKSATKKERRKRARKKPRRKATAKKAKAAPKKAAPSRSGRSAGRPRQRPLRADRAAQGAPGRRPGPRPAHREGAGAAAVLARAAPPQDIHKLIDSAAANAENNHDLIADEMRVAEITVDEGPTLKRYRPAGAGSRDPDPQANQPHRRGADPGRGLRIHGTEDPPRGLPRRLHPRLEVELVRREELRRRPRGGPADPRSHRRQALARRPLRHHDRAPRRGRRRHPHRPPRHRDRQVGQRSRRAAQGAAQAHRQARSR